MLTGVTIAFRGVVIGSLLGDAVSVQVRGVDYIAVAATLVLGLLAVADVLLLNITERAAELATIRSFGWRESALGRLVVTEGAIIGLLGSAVGAGLGLAGESEFTGQHPAGLSLIAAAAVTAGVVVTACAALLPAQALRHLPAAHCSPRSSPGQCQGISLACGTPAQSSSTWVSVLHQAPFSGGCQGLAVTAGPMTSEGD